jgi:hypothetical protein
MAFNAADLQACEACLDGSHTEWVYHSTDPIATVVAPAFINVGGITQPKRNMRVGDELFIKVVTVATVPTPLKPAHSQIPTGVVACGYRWVSAVAANGDVTLSALT